MIWDIFIAIGIVTTTGFLLLVACILYLFRWPIWWEIKSLWRKK